MDMKPGAQVILTCDGQSTQGTVVLCSGDKEALAVTFDEGLNTTRGLFINGVALILRDGKYQELCSGAVFEIALTQ